MRRFSVALTTYGDRNEGLACGTSSPSVHHDTKRKPLVQFFGEFSQRVLMCNDADPLTISWHVAGYHSAKAQKERSCYGCISGMRSFDLGSGLLSANARPKITKRGAVSSAAPPLYHSPIAMPSRRGSAPPCRVSPMLMACRPEFRLRMLTSYPRSVNGASSATLSVPSSIS